MSRILKIAVAVGAGLAIAGSAAAGTMYHDDFSDFGDTWVRAETGIKTTQMSDSVMLESGSERPWVARVTRTFVPMNFDGIDVDYTLSSGGLTLKVARYDSSYSYMGMSRLAVGPDGSVDMSRVDWASTGFVRFHIMLDTDSMAEVREIRAFASNAAHMPEPSAALLLGIGMLVGTARVRRERKR